MANSVRLTFSSQWAAYSMASRSLLRKPGVFSRPAKKLVLRWRCWATSRFSTAVISLNRRTFWKVRTTPLWAILWPGRVSICSPSRRMLPEVGW
ncbi:hypothetical protein D9M71_672520 [compost metagenome]